jgi:outer membrane protein
VVRVKYGMPKTRGSRPLLGLGIAVLAVIAGAGQWPRQARADTLESSLVLAYTTNPQLNSQRAIVRQTDEGVPQALSGYRPKVVLSGTLGEQYLSSTTKLAPSVPQWFTFSGNNTPHGAGVTATQTVYNGLQTANRMRAAESQVSAARETLRLLTQQVLLDAATAYMNLLRDSAILELQRRNVEVLQERLQQTRDRLAVGEVTRTDVAQAQARLAGARSQLLIAQSNYTSSRAQYRLVIGVDPGTLAPGAPVDRLSPRTLDAAIAQGMAEHPSVTAAMYGVDVAALTVKISEGALYPTVTLQGQVQRQLESSLVALDSYNASIVGTLSVPLYQGGAEYSTIRQSKETLGQKRLDLDTTRNQARSTVVQSWGQLDAAKAQIQSTKAQETAAEIALNGVREEARVGQRTTLDVLNSEQELVNARVARVTAERDRVVASYTLLASVGRLSVEVLGLNTPVYDARVHYQQVRDSWAGVRTPDGR